MYASGRFVLQKMESYMGFHTERLEAGIVAHSLKGRRVAVKLFGFMPITHLGVRKPWVVEDINLQIKRHVQTMFFYTLFAITTAVPQNLLTYLV